MGALEDPAIYQDQEVMVVAWEGVIWVAVELDLVIMEEVAL